MKVVGLSNLSDAYKNYLVVLIKRTLVSMTTEKKKSMYVHQLYYKHSTILHSMSAFTQSHQAHGNLLEWWAPHIRLYLSQMTIMVVPHQVIDHQSQRHCSQLHSDPSQQLNKM